MKHIRKFESYRNNKNVVNEEILGSVINFFKNMWNKAAEEIKKLEAEWAAYFTCIKAAVASLKSTDKVE